MKKSKILMLLPAFLLVGCAKSINKEDAQAKAQQINEYQEQHPVTEFKFEMYSLEQEDSEKEEQRASYEFSEEKVYFHIKAEETDMYAYKQDSKYYVVNAAAKQYREYGEALGIGCDRPDRPQHLPQLRGDDRRGKGKRRRRRAGNGADHQRGYPRGLPVSQLGAGDGME